MDERGGNPGPSALKARENTGFRPWTLYDCEWHSCPRLPVLTAGSCSGCPVLLFNSWMVRPSWLSCSSVFLCLRCSGCPFLVVLLWCCSGPVLAVLSWFSNSGCTVHYGCPVLVSCSVTDVLAVMSWLSCSVPVLVTLFCLTSSTCPLLAVLL